ncbi:metalloregulator ArsR/SmtB family transcription factor [Actinokineospora sp. HUAS TT18]|uniref:metalloregulator ArsR/SmtB family transcription factor n=1 Tax=Actinokineospora sp. HUAS TT18 TaxID=3447451 RepID=UPI003F5232A1
MMTKHQQPPCCSPITEAPLTADDAADLVRGFKAVADPVRLRLLSMIASNSNKEVCVCDMTGAFDLSGPTISHHLKVLREAGLIDNERRGTWVFYRANLEVLERLAAVLGNGISAR